MEVLNIVIQSLEDARNGKEIVNGLTADNLKETKNMTVGILECGTVQGQTVLMFLLKNSDGTYSMSQITENHFEFLKKTFEGAQERFRIAKGKRN